MLHHAGQHARGARRAGSPHELARGRPRVEQAPAIGRLDLHGRAARVVAAADGADPERAAARVARAPVRNVAGGGQQLAAGREGGGRRVRVVAPVVVAQH